MSRWIFLFAIFRWMTACTGGVDGPDGIVELPPCEIPLNLEPATARIGPRGLLALTPSGGTGRYHFALTANVSGGRVHMETGLYQAGPTMGLDRVELTDAGCRGMAAAEVEVAPGLVLVPAHAEVPPGTAIAFEVSGGSGTVMFELARNESGGSVDASGRYVAGAMMGQDLVRATDMATMQSAEATIDVSASAALTAITPRLFIPVGSTAMPPVRGGSGELDATITGDAVRFEGGLFIADRPGRAMVTLRDRFTAQTVALTVEAIGPYDAPHIAVGNRYDANRIVPLGDPNGDGFEDIAVAMQGVNVSSFSSGAVFLYRGTATGFEAAPARVLSGERRDDDYGYSIAVGDIDGDSLADLLIGAFRADRPTGDAGAVYVYRGVAGQFFSEAPTSTFLGVNAGDNLGSDIALCDFNGDGALDVAIGAPSAEDRERAVRTDQQGAVSVFLSYDGRFLGTPTMQLFGEYPTGTALDAFGNMRFGETLAAGDFDGDSFCDLAVRSRDADPDPMANDDGAVSLFRGRATTETSRGGLYEQPSIVWNASEATDRRSFFGLSLAMADLDGDGKADLVASAHLHDRTEGGDAGAIYAFRGRMLGDAPASAFTPATMSDWFVEGATGGEYVGNSVVVGDVNGDAIPDIVSGDSRFQMMDAEGRTGAVRAYFGRSGSLPATTPDRDHLGMEIDARFGMAVGLGGGSAIVAFSGTADASGLDVGKLHVVPSSGSYAELELPIEASGRRLGEDVALVGDVNGDGFEDLVVGAISAVSMMLGPDSGAAYLYLGTATGFAPMPSVALQGFTGHGGGENIASRVAPIGDFDGDGARDFAILSLREDLAALPTATMTHVPIGDCATARNDPGAVLVFRGTRSGMPSAEPAFVLVGPYAGRNTQDLAGGFDVDGDGLDDVVLGGENWNRGMGDPVGGVAVVRGRAADTMGRITVLCDAWVYDEPGMQSGLGASVAPLGDLDADGCEEFAAGAPALDGFARDDGGAYVFFGFGATCATPATRVVRFASGSAAANAGRTIASGDLDGDSRPDLVVGADRFRDGRGEVGRAYVVLSRYIMANAAATELVPLLDRASVLSLAMDGTASGERLGSSVAVVPRSGGVGPWIAAGGSFGAISGMPNTGAVHVHAFGATGIDPAPYALVSGETTRAGSELGSSLGASASSRLAIGARWSSTTGLEEGAAFTIDLAD